MDIQTTKIALIKEILNIDTPELINKMYEFIKKEKVDFWDELSLEQQQEILAADNEVVNEQTLDYENFISSHRNE